MIESFLDFLYIKTVGVSLLIAIILVLRPIILKTMNAKLAYQLWLIVPIFLLIPIIDYSNISAGNQLTVYLNQQQVLPAIPTLAGDQDSSNFNILLAIWGAGFIASLFFYLFGCYQLKNSFKTISKQPQAMLLDLEKLSSSRNLKFVESKFFNSPAVFGFLTAYIILPKDFHELDNEQQQVILSHELHHVQRRDYQTNHIRNFIRCVFWFNPLVYIADKYFEADQELSCDLGVLQTTHSITTQSYAKVLVNEATNKNRTMLLSQWNYSSLIKERIKMLGRNNNKLWHKLATFLIAVSSVGYANLLVAGTAKKESVNPLSVIQPMYPRQAAEENIEGFVKFNFDLNKSGNPTNIKIVESEPKGVFDKAAKDAFEKWTFKTSDYQNVPLSYSMAFSLGLDQNQAIPLKVFAPRYPKDAAENNIEGRVLFKFDLTEDGKAKNIKIVNSKPEGVFDTVALESLKTWTFKVEGNKTQGLSYAMKFSADKPAKPTRVKKQQKVSVKSAKRAPSKSTLTEVKPVKSIKK